MLGTILSRLNEPFPARNQGVAYWRDAIATGVFIALFLYLLRPFGLHRVQEGALLISLGFGVVTILFSTSFHAFSARILGLRTDLPSWTLWKWILYSICLVSWIAVGNFLFIFLIDDSPGLTLPVFFAMLKNTLLVGFFPVVFFGLGIQVRAFKENQKQANAISVNKAVSPERVSVLSFPLTSNEDLQVPQDKLRYIEAMQNYVSIYYWDADAICTKLIRSTIAKTEAELEKSPLVRCHRSYIVNVDAVQSVSGNAQGLKLKLNNVDNVEVPVSRSYIPRLRELLAH